jgi:hypothetical protein
VSTYSIIGCGRMINDRYGLERTVAAASWIPVARATRVERDWVFILKMEKQDNLFS